MSDGGQIHLTAAALPCWTATTIPCIRICRECGSLVSALILRPSSLMKVIACGPGTPDVLMVTGTEKGVLLGFCLLGLAGHQPCFPCSKGYMGRGNGYQGKWHPILVSDRSFMESLKSHPASSFRQEHVMPVGSRRVGIFAEPVIF